MIQPLSRSETSLSASLLTQVSIGRISEALNSYESKFSVRRIPSIIMVY
jgi:hypothetical protein